MPVYIGGAELNVATALASWDIKTKYCTSLPEHYLSVEIVEEIARKGIDVSAIHHAGERIGIYYLPQGADLKQAGVIYDRSGSSFSVLQPGMIDWHRVLDGCDWFHFSAISPALNESAAAVCQEALEVAVGKGLRISIDLNYRSRLWQYGKKPVSIMPGLVQYCDVVMGNIWAAESLLGVSSPIQDSNNKSRDELIDAAGASMKAIHHAYPKVQSIAYTYRLEQSYFAILQHGPDRVISREFPLVNIVDKVGSGDCFMGGLIYGLYNSHAPQEVIDFAAAAAVGKMSEKGDATHQNVATVLNTIQNT